MLGNSCGTRKTGDAVARVLRPLRIASTSSDMGGLEEFRHIIEKEIELWKADGFPVKKAQTAGTFNAESMGTAMDLNKDPDAWRRLSAEAVMARSLVQGEQVLRMAIEDILRMDAEIARLRAMLEQAIIDRDEAWQRIDVVRRTFASQNF